MPNVTYFAQDCPTCGRKLNVRVEYLGKKVVCQHCNGSFLAWDPEGAPPETVQASLSGTKLMDRAAELIEMAEQKIAESRIIKRRVDAAEASVEVNR